MTIEKLNIERMGVALSIDVTKLDKSRFVSGKNGAKYCDLTVWLSPDEADEWGKHGGIQIAATKEEQEAKEKMPYCGNAKVFWAKKATQWVGYFGENEKKQEPKKEQQGFDDLEDIPF